MRDEEEARHSGPSNGPSSQRTTAACIRETSLDGTPSYVELQTCLEIASDNKARLGKQ